MGVRQLYKQVPEAVWASWSQLGTRCRSESQRQTEGFGPLVTHGWATPAKMWKKCCYGQKNLGQYVAVCPRLQLTSHTQPTSTLSRIKCERYIFIKKCVHSFIEVIIIVDYVSAYICIRVVVLRLYNTISSSNNESLKLVDQFICLGSNITSTESNVSTHKGKIWTAINKLSTK